MDKIATMLAGQRKGFTEAKFDHPDFDYARWLRNHGAIDYWKSHPPVGDIGVNEHFSDKEKTDCVSYAVIDNSMKQKMRVFLRSDLL